jgi:hypothetical protein
VWLALGVYVAGGVIGYSISGRYTEHAGNPGMVTVIDSAFAIAAPDSLFVSSQMLPSPNFGKQENKKIAVSA